MESGGSAGGSDCAGGVCVGANGAARTGTARTGTGTGADAASKSAREIPAAGAASRSCRNGEWRDVGDLRHGDGVCERSAVGEFIGLDDGRRSADERRWGGEHQPGRFERGGGFELDRAGAGGWVFAGPWLDFSGDGEELERVRAGPEDHAGVERVDAVLRDAIERNDRDIGAEKRGDGDLRNDDGDGARGVATVAGRRSQLRADDAGEGGSGGGEGADTDVGLGGADGADCGRGRGHLRPVSRRRPRQPG